MNGSEMGIGMSIFDDRINTLRCILEQKGIDFYIVPTADFHNSEYVSEYFSVRKYLSGFTGSAGTLIISKKEAGLWTDGRYFVQAEKELKDSDIVLYKSGEEGVPTVSEYLKDNVQEYKTIGFDGRVISADFGFRLETMVEEKKVKFVYDKDYADMVWDDRPLMPSTPIWCVPENLCGENVSEKLKRVRESMAEEKSENLLISKLDDIMWLYNIRANDVECNPVALSYSFITTDKAFIFVQKEAVSEELITYFNNNDIQLKDYNEIVDFLANNSFKGKTWCSKKDTNYMLYKLVSSKTEIVDKANPTELLKAVKNETELENIRKYYLLDSVVLTKFLFWMKKNVGKMPMDEITVAKKLDDMRREIEGFLDLSFPTISAYRENAAMAHYSATAEDKSEIKAEGFYLVDSGAQYIGGTTDVTRTIVLGKISDEMKMHFTKVACGMLRLAKVKFLKGCTGRNLDIIARQPLWECGLDFKHGTGHGIGYILNVHEGPHSLRWQYREDLKEVELEKGMIVSDEPGMYVANSHGIRTENIIEVVNEDKNEYGQFMGFKHLTFVPIDLEGIDISYMEPADVKNLNDYHRNVHEKLVDFFEGEEKEMLRCATRELPFTF